MRHSVSASVTVTAPCVAVFEALTNLDNLMLWNSGMKAVSKSGSMQEGLSYETTNVVIGQQFVSRVNIVKLLPHELIEMKSDGGAVAYWAQYQFVENPTGVTKLICIVEFEPKSIALSFAHAIVSEIARNRLEADLKTLRALIEKQ